MSATAFSSPNLSYTQHKILFNKIFSPPPLKHKSLCLPLDSTYTGAEGSARLLLVSGPTYTGRVRKNSLASIFSIIDSDTQH